MLVHIVQCLCHWKCSTFKLSVGPSGLGQGFCLLALCIYSLFFSLHGEGLAVLEVPFTSAETLATLHGATAETDPDTLRPPV